jgi:hypothetical protein
MARARLKRIVDSQNAASPRLAEAKTDFRAFCELVRIAPKDPRQGSKVPLHHNAIQNLFEVNRTGRDVVLKPRQIGFTTLEVARDLWTFVAKPGARVVIVCQSTSDGAPAKLISGVLILMISALIEAGWPLKFRTEAWNEWVLDNGNSLRIAVAGASETSASKKGRAGTITRLHLTETAFYEYAATTLNALYECVPGPETGSEIVSESTPNGAAGTFFEQCKSAQLGKTDFKFHFYPWHLHEEYRRELDPGEELELDDEELEFTKLGVTHEQLKWRRLKIAEKGRSAFDQEYASDPETCFLVSGSGYFDSDRVTQIIANTEGIKPLETRSHGQVRIYAAPRPGTRYVLALDPSEGTGGDPAAGIMLDQATGEHVATIDGQFTPYQLAKEAAALATEYNEALIAPERNNHGHAVILALTKTDGVSPPLYSYVYEHDDERFGFPNNPATRPEMLSDFEDAIRNRYATTTDAAVASQLRTFVLIDGKPQAANGANDDLVMAYAIGWSVRQRLHKHISKAIKPRDREAPRFFGRRGFG